MQKLKVLQAYGQIDIYKEIQEPLDQDFLIRNILESQHFTNYPPAATFERSFWKWVLQTIELAGEEVDERIYHRYMALLPPQTEPGLDISPAPSSSYTTYLIDIPPESKDLLGGAASSPFVAPELPGLLCITMMESRKTFEQGTTGLRTWQPGLIFADWLLRNPSESALEKLAGVLTRLAMAKGRVLELGCGAGLTGTITASIQRALSRHGERGLSICMTDIDESVISTCKRNMNLVVNRLSDETETTWTLLDWNDALPAAAGRDRLLAVLSEINPSVVFGTDLVYDVTIVPALAHMLSTLIFCLSPPPEVVLAISLRRQATIDTFLAAIGRLALKFNMHDLPQLEDTVFASRRNDVDKALVVKLVRIFRNQDA